MSRLSVSMKELELLGEIGYPAAPIVSHLLAAGFLPALILFAAYRNQMEGPKVSRCL